MALILVQILPGCRQAIYNDGGSVLITGNSSLSGTSNQRATVQNQSGGTITIESATITAASFSSVLNNSGGTVIITGGTIISNHSIAVDNRGTLTIGTKDGNININSPVLQGKTYGIGHAVGSEKVRFKMYDGILKGITSAYDSKKSIIDDTEPNASEYNSTETIDGSIYNTLILDCLDTVTFDPTGGTVSPSSIGVLNGMAVGSLPIPIKTGNVFAGWFTLDDGGEEVTPSRIINGDVTFYAHWTQAKIAQINETQYDSLTEAISAVASNNTATTIKLLVSTYENITISKNQNIILDLQGNTLKNSQNAAVIENSGTLLIQNGTITSSVGFAVINNNGGGRITVSSGSIISRGTRQAIYNNKGGTVIINGSAYLSSTATGAPSGSTIERATIQNMDGGTLIITGGTIIGVNQHAVSNEGTLTIGTEDGEVNTTLPVLNGKMHGVNNYGTFNFYDGILRGENAAIYGDTNSIENGYQITLDEDNVNGTAYHQAYLTPIIEDTTE